MCVVLVGSTRFARFVCACLGRFLMSEPVREAEWVRQLPIRKLLTNVAEPESPEERDEAWNEIERRAADRDRLAGENKTYRAALEVYADPREPPMTHRGQLAQAAAVYPIRALIAAEIDRLQRAAFSDSKEAE